MNAVLKDAEFRRISSLPRRAKPRPVHIPGLRGEQPYMLGTLAEAAAMGSCYGALVGAGVGAGKTLPFLLAPRIFGVEKYLQVVPVDLREKTKLDWNFYIGLGFDLPPLHLATYHDLSGKDHARYLTEDLELIACDEPQAIRRLSAGRTKRLREFFVDNPQVRFAAFSATFLQSDINDLNHLAEWALRDRTPLPRDYRTATVWGEAMNPGVYQRPTSGAFADWPGYDGPDPVACARRAFARRFRDTPGVFISEVASTDVPLTLKTWEPDLDADIEGALAELRDMWTRPDGHTLALATEFAMASRAMGIGFYHRWKEYPEEEWYHARKTWADFVAHWLRYGRGLATEGDVKVRYPNAVEWACWAAMQETFIPQPEVVWISDVIVRQAAEWLMAGPGRCVWVAHPEVGERVAQLAGVPYFGAGKKAAEKVATHEGPCVLSHRSHGTGKNLQRYWEALVLEPPVSASKWEQLIGRHHRQGQTEKVNIWVPIHTEELVSQWDRTFEEAVMLRDTGGVVPKVLRARTE